MIAIIPITLDYFCTILMTLCKVLFGGNQLYGLFVWIRSLLSGNMK